ncbi:MAG: sigma-54 interaction domain-containing protein [Planctomycetota bacterium]
MLVRVLLAIDDARLRARLRRTLAQNDVLVESVENSERVWMELARAACDMVVVSRALVPDPVVESLQSFRSLPEAPEVVILDENDDPENRARWMAAGCHAVLAPNLSTTALRDVMHALLGRQRSAAATKLFAGRSLTEPRLSDFITSSAAMHTFMSLVNRVVASDTSLLILGETGVGKEHLARAIYAESPRASGPFIAVNCGALPEALLESELFGHEQGAFTGATRSRRGCFELAHRGVLFLDEIGELPHHLQVKLLHVLQRREIQRLGSESAFSVDVRVIAATNRDIEAEVEEKRFRTDLYYRLSVVTLAIPPLRDRSEDIAVLVDSYLDYFRGHIRRNVTGITREALDALRRYDWPGNVRELVNIIERAMLLSTGEDIQLDDLPESIRNLGPAYVPRVIPAGAVPGPDALAPALLRKPLRQAREAVLADFEMNYLVGLLRETNGKIGETARRAGIEPRSLFDKMKRFGLKKEDFRAAKAE